MRLTLDATRLAYIAGKGLVPARPMVTVREVDGVDVEIAPGHTVRWASGDRAVFGPQEDGPLGAAAAPRWAVTREALPSGNTVTAAAGQVALHRDDPTRILSTFRAPFLGATHPVLSDDGAWLVYRLPDQPRDRVSTLVLERTDGEGEPRILWTGAPTNVRAAGRTFVWETGGGRLAGIADAGNPHAEVEAFDALAPAWRLYEPVPLWHAGRGELGLLFLADDGRNGHILYADWASLRAGQPTGFPLGVSTGTGYEHDLRPQGLGARAVWFAPDGRVVDGVLDLDAPRVRLTPPASVLEPPPPPPPAPLEDIPWTPDPTRTVDMLTFVTAAAAAYRSTGPHTGDLWLHKSQERPDWGENWDHDADYIGFVEDRSTGTRMVSMARPKVHGHTNTRRNRLSPEEILERNARGEQLGDPLTLPLAGYTWRGNRVWMTRHVTGRAEVRFHTDYVWWDLPQFGGVWEVWAGLPLTSVVETGYARFNGHDVYARSRYGKPAGDEWNYWGPHGWIAFRAYDAHGVEERGTASTKPAGAVASPLTAPFVPARFTPTYPIYDAARERQPEPTRMPDTVTTAQIAALIGELNDPILLGARQRYRDEVLLARDRVSAATDGDGQPANHTDMMTGGAAMFFDRGYVRDYLIARVRGQDVMGASVAGLIGAAGDYRRAVGLVEPTQPSRPAGPFSGPISTSGRDFVTP